MVSPVGPTHTEENERLIDRLPPVGQEIEIDRCVNFGGSKVRVPDHDSEIIPYPASASS